ncbi:MAG: DUF922 domain-containing Zn-dependent protease [Longimicrobiales bacterium]|jgi:predicted secreted Zn-dependent protease|nr:DUF922 domain-containing Zn-dependent protease [Longimicrobiales bacterium]
MRGLHLRPCLLVFVVWSAPAAVTLSGQTSGQRSPDDVVVVESSEAYYELPDSTLTDVIARLNRTRLAGAGGQMSQGLTEYHIQPSWQPAGAGGRCRVARLGLEVQVRITLPSWPAERFRPEAERASWRTIENAIRSHEYRHRDLTVEAARELARELEALETRGCRALEQVFAGAVALADARLQEAHSQLDRDTPARLSVGRKEGHWR